jgi:dTDP-4-dehydrorhamnose 3,5-epimerase-like enzyme
MSERAAVRRTELKEHSDERGWVVDPMVPPFPGVPLGQVHVASLEPGAVRGNHMHPDVTEYVFTWGGPVDVVWQPEGGELAREEVRSGDLSVFEIPPGVRHAVMNVGEERVYLIAYYLGGAEGQWPETERVELV